MTSFGLNATTPIEFKKEDESRLAVFWKDGHKSLYYFRDLRGACQCASCVDERTGVSILNSANVPEDIRLLSASPVGRYGVQFRWSDGHGTGIYAFDYLRSLCPCPTCQAARQPRSDQAADGGPAESGQATRQPL